MLSQLEEKEKQYHILLNTPEEEIWLNELETLENSYETFASKRRRIIEDEIKDDAKASKKKVVKSRKK